ncbi:MAG: septum formation inhibitor Maf [Tissierellia bacterium]|nr:septum formation inhibitor Maf [Tissierellia bacterium]
MEKIILASSSPRRIELLRKYNFNPVVVKAEIQEKTMEGEKPEQIAMALAFEKASWVSNKFNDGEIIIGADTIVVFKDEILGKPRDKEDAFRMLKALSGNEHSVITGICIIKAGSNLKLVDYESTLVKFRDLTDEKISNYIDTKEPMDKAGAYGIQGFGEILVEKINGCYSNVVGLPISKLDNLLGKYFGVNML